MTLKLGSKLYQDWVNAANLLDSGADFSMDETFFITHFQIDTEIIGYHFQIWQKCFPHILDYGFITSCSPVKPRLTFNSEDSRDLFLKWWNDLDSHFPEHWDKRTNMYPKLPNDQVVTGTIVPCYDKNKAWAWIIMKCKGLVWFIDNRLLFESDSDVVMYKMDFLHKED